LGENITPPTYDVGKKSNQAYSEYKHSVAFCVRLYVVTATKPVHLLQIHPIVHNQRAPPTIP